MKEKKIFGLSLDFWGFSGSFLCAVHCLALPILVSIGVLGHMHLHETFIWEWMLFFVLLVIAVVSLVSSFRHRHGNFLPLALATVGIAFIFIGIIYHAHAAHFWSGVGGLSLATAHLLNWFLLRKLKVPSAA